MSDEKEGTGWILEGGAPKQIEYLSGFAPADGFPYVVEKSSQRSVMGRIHLTKEALLEAVEKDYQQRIKQKKDEAKALRTELARIRKTAQ